MLVATLFCTNRSYISKATCYSLCDGTGVKSQNENAIKSAVDLVLLYFVVSAHYLLGILLLKHTCAGL